MLYLGWTVRAAAVWVAVLAGCQFDQSGGVDGPDVAVDAAVSGGPDAAPRVVDAAAGSDALAQLCKDEDGDGFKFPIVPGSDCGVLDCNDSDELAHPDQDGAFTTPTSVGDFDYNCDGVETKVADTRDGDECNRPPFGSCEGTGWLGGVPDCGEVGVYHRCDSDIFSCFEAEQTELAMPCN